MVANVDVIFAVWCYNIIVFDDLIEENRINWNKNCSPEEDYERSGCNKRQKYENQCVEFLFVRLKGIRSRISSGCFRYFLLFLYKELCKLKFLLKC